MKKFMDDNFLLQNDVAVSLYHNHAKDMPIYDYHCHLSPEEIHTDKSYKNITEVWLGGDHYKWRAMRSNGVDEKYITGDASDYEKFLAWAKTVPQCIGNPLYHWTHLELKRYFGIEELLSEDTAEDIWNRANELIQSGAFTAKSLIKKSNVKVICTTDDPVDSLEFHKAIAADESFDVKVLPTFRPDKALAIDKPTFLEYVAALEKAADRTIATYHDFQEALKDRLAFFHEVGARISDHAFDTVVYKKGTETQAAEFFHKALKGDSLTADEVAIFRTQTFQYLAKEYHRLGWVQQIHIGALRNNNTRRFETLGPDTGFDSIHDESVAGPLARILDDLDYEDTLPKTILYNLNPKDNHVLGTMIGNFQGGGIPGKIQFGSGWWFLDQKDGMEAQMRALSNLGLLSRFVGMLTDSRSFLSYPRHEYFRRILANLIGTWVEEGQFPHDEKLLGAIMENICYNNARNYFPIDVE